VPLNFSWFEFEAPLETRFVSLAIRGVQKSINKVMNITIIAENTIFAWFGFICPSG
jgi:hypothetical protein